MSAPTLYLWNLPADTSELDILAAFPNLKLTSVRFSRQSTGATGTDNKPMVNLQQATICFQSEAHLLLADEKPSIKGVSYKLSSVPYSAGAKGSGQEAAATDKVPDLLAEYMTYLEDTDGVSIETEPTVLPVSDTSVIRTDDDSKPSFNGIPVPHEPPFVVYFPYNSEPVPFAAFASFGHPFDAIGCQLPNPKTGDPASITFGSHSDLALFLGRVDWDCDNVRLRPSLSKTVPTDAEVKRSQSAELAKMAEIAVLSDAKVDEKRSQSAEQPKQSVEAKEIVPAPALEEVVTNPNSQIADAELAVAENKNTPVDAAATEVKRLDTTPNVSKADTNAQPKPAATKTAAAAAVAQPKVRIVQPVNAASVPHYPPYVLYVYGLEAHTDLPPLLDFAAVTRVSRYGPQLECARLEFAQRDDLVRIVSKDGIWLGDRRIELSLTELEGMGTAPVAAKAQPALPASKQPIKASQQLPPMGQQSVKSATVQPKQQPASNQLVRSSGNLNSQNMRSIPPQASIAQWQLPTAAVMAQHGVHLGPRVWQPDPHEDRLQLAGRCGFCDQLAELMCSRCEAVYCSERCQHIDWPHHSRICTPIPLLVPMEQRSRNYNQPPPNVMVDVDFTNYINQQPPDYYANQRESRTHSTGRYSNGSNGPNGSNVGDVNFTNYTNQQPANNYTPLMRAARFNPSGGMNQRESRAQSASSFTNGSNRSAAAVQTAAPVAAPAAVPTPASAAPVAAQAPAQKSATSVAKLPANPIPAPDLKATINNPFKKKPKENIILGDAPKKAYPHPKQALNAANWVQEPTSNKPVALPAARNAANVVQKPTPPVTVAPVVLPASVVRPEPPILALPITAPSSTPTPAAINRPPSPSIQPIVYRPMRRERIDVPYCVMPASGTTVSITEVISANTCFVRPNTPLCNREYSNVLQQIADYAHKTAQPMLEVPVVGQVLLARHPRLGFWARVLVLRVLSAESTAETEAKAGTKVEPVAGTSVLLAFIDYGPMATIALTDCRELAAELQQLTRYVHRVKVQMTGDGAEALEGLCGKRLTIEYELPFGLGSLVKLRQAAASPDPATK